MALNGERLDELNDLDRKDIQIRRAEHAPLSTLKPSDIYDSFQIEKMGSGHSLRSDEMDLVVGSKALPFELKTDRFLLPVGMKAIQDAVIKFRKDKGQLIFDGTSIRLETDLSLEIVTDTSPIKLAVREAGFFSMLATNDMTPFEAVSRETGELILDGKDLLLGPDGCIRNLDSPILNNSIGVSTLAVCSDGKALFYTQSGRNSANGGLLVCSGSGSLAPEDVKLGISFQEMVISGMERELAEEQGLDNVDMNTRLIGFSRWLERGAKPEFYGFTLLNQTSDEVLGLVLNSEEASLKEDVLAEPIEFFIEKMDHHMKNRKELSEWSLPLAGCVRSLVVHLENDPTFQLKP